MLRDYSLSIFRKEKLDIIWDFWIFFVYLPSKSLT